MTAELLALIESDPAAGILAVADLREQRAKAATPGPWGDPDDVHVGDFGWSVADCPAGETEDSEQGRADAAYIAAEHPGVALVAVFRWKETVKRHQRIKGAVCGWCAPAAAGLIHRTRWPCPDLTETADEAKAYLGAPS